MASLVVRSVVSPLAVALAAGTAFGQAVVFQYDAQGTNANWTDAANWTNPSVAQPGGERRPPVDGGNNVIVDFEATGAQVISNVNRVTAGATFYTLNGLSFDHRAPGADFLAVTLQGVQLRMVAQANGTVATMVDNTDGRTHTVNNDLELRTNLSISGACNNLGELWLNGVISQNGGARALTIGFGNGGGVQLAGANTYTGGTTLNGGRLIIANNNALGASNGLVINNTAGAPIIYAAPDSQWTLPNNILIQGNAAPTFGANNSASGSLRFNGEMDVNAPANAPRVINLVGGREHTLALGGGILLAQGRTLNIQGDTAPDLMAGSLRLRTQRAAPGQPAILKSDSWGSRIVFAGGFTKRMAGNVNILAATLDIQDNMGGPGADGITSLITIGDGTMANRGALMGRQPVAGVRGRPGIPPLTLNFAGAGGITPSGVKINPKSRLQPGASPGLMAINNGLVQMEPGSSFGTTLNGLLPGDGEGFYGQLLLENGSHMTLACSATNERPILGMECLTYDPATNLDNFAFSLGQSFVIIDQDSALMASLYSPADQFGYGGSMFMSPEGAALSQDSVFACEGLPQGLFFRINYYGGDTGNDVVLSVVAPTPGAASLALAGGVLGLRRKRR